MPFNSLEYAVLLTTVFVGTYALGGVRAPRHLLLLAASYGFYAWGNPSHLPLLAAISVLDHFVALRIRAASTPGRRRAWLAAGLVANLGPLVVIKYFDLLAGSATGLVSTVLGLDLAAPRLGWARPLGLSFFTLQASSYLIDVHRGEVEPTPRLLDTLLYVAFFPNVVAGPIVRASCFLPQLDRPVELPAPLGTRALLFIAIGLVKKAIIADLLAVNLVDRVFQIPARYTSAELLLGVYGYAFQIYCDFSAYSDIAIGSALLCGLSLPRNFDHPYRSESLPEFWRRWHISLSSWLRDYLFSSLGGAFGSALRAYRNLLVTMLLGGLWHEASWTFALWGLLHGTGLVATRAVQAARAHRSGPRQRRRRRRPLALRILRALATFHLVCLGWIFFRAPDLDGALELLSGLAALTGGTANISPLLAVLLLAGLATHLVSDGVLARVERAVAALPSLVQAALLVAVVLATRWAGTTGVVPFIYFQY
jgi:alginate O-acetyltransferase complex protein AlgI